MKLNFGLIQGELVHSRNLTMGLKKLSILFVLGLVLTGLPQSVVGLSAVGPGQLWRGLSAQAQTTEGQQRLLAAEDLFAQRQYEAALGIYQSLIPQTSELADKATLYRQISRSFLLLGRYEDAIPVLIQGIELRKQAWGYGAEPDLSNLGLAYYHTEQWGEAEAVLQEAIAGWEAIRDRTDNDLDKITLFEQQSYTYSLLQRVLVAQGKQTEALELSEQSRAQALVEQLAQQATGQRQTLPPPTLAEIQRIARQEQATLVTYSVLGDGRRVLGNELETEMDLLIWVVKPNGQVISQTVPMQPIWRQFRERMENLTPLESLVQSSRAALGVSSRGFGDFNWSTANVRRPSQLPDLDAVSLKSLYQLLIEPIAEALPTDPNERVIFIPQRSLFLVPFASLRDTSGTYLIEQHTFSVSPSIQALALTEQTTPFSLDGPALVIGNPAEMPVLPNGDGQPLPALPGAEQEAIAIANLLDTDPWVAEEATETAIMGQLRGKSILHFATHGLVDFDATLNEFGLPTQTEIPTSAETGVIVTPGAVIIGDNVTVGGIPAEIALAREGVIRVKMPGLLALAPSGQDDGWLTAEDIAGLDLDAKLVVLSACNTGRGRITGDGVLGLSRAFMMAGAPSVVVSLWQVPDMPTALLMEEFYRQLQQTPNKAVALRHAMLTVKESHPNPKNWAGFMLMGQMD